MVGMVNRGDGVDGDVEDGVDGGDGGYAVSA